MQNDPEDVARQQLEAVRALAKAVAALETEEKSSMRKTYTPLRAGKPWSAVEDEELRTEFARKITIQKMASHHHRQRGGITARLERLGLISSQLAMNFAGPFGVLPNKHLESYRINIRWTDKNSRRSVRPGSFPQEI